jgi:UDP-apiose/xylose synthase
MNSASSQTLCILGCGGFIGSHLLRRILDDGGRRVIGIDITSAKIDHLLAHPDLSFVKLNVHDSDAVRSHIEQCDTVISLVALCNPALYNTIPLDVIDINFNRPLDIVRTCAERGKRLIHFSTSEVYGRTIASFAGDAAEAENGNREHWVLNEDRSPLIMGPIQAQRWSYAAAKQLLERVIYAYGFERGLDYTVIRPFNFIGPRMDFIPGIDGEGVPRVLACFMDALLHGTALRLVDGGRNRRNFTYIDDAVDAIVRILARPAAARRQVFNIGNPANEVTIAELAEKMIGAYKRLRPECARRAFGVEHVAGSEFYGPGYEDSDRRMPDIDKARRLLGWAPDTDLDTALEITMRAYIDEYGSHSARKQAC